MDYQPTITQFAISSVNEHTHTQQTNRKSSSKSLLKEETVQIACTKI